jgi:hypothetical protein
MKGPLTSSLASNPDEPRSKAALLFLPRGSRMAHWQRVAVVLGNSAPRSRRWRSAGVLAAKLTHDRFHQLTVDRYRPN